MSQKKQEAMPDRQVRNVGRPNLPSGRGFNRPRPAPSSTPTPRRRPGRSRLWWVKYVLGAAALFFLWRYFLIGEVQIQGAQTISPKLIELSVRKGLRSQLLGDNLITFSPGRLEQSVIGEIPEIKHLSFKRGWPTRLIITVSEREPSLAWRSGGVLYLLDRDGTVIRQITDKQGKLAVVTDTTNLPVKAGERVVPSRFVAFTLDTAAGLAGLGEKVKDMSVRDTTSELNVNLARGFLVKFDTTRGAGSQIHALQLVLSSLAKSGRRPKEYVDLRVEGKAYYK